MIRVRVLAVVAVAALVAPAAGCQQDPPSPSQQAAERLHRAADHLDRAGSVELLVTVTVGGTLWSGRQRGTAWLSLGADSAASRATADVDVKAVGDDQSVEIEFRDYGAEPGRVVQVAIRAVVSRTGEPVTVAAPEDARTVPAA